MTDIEQRAIAVIRGLAMDAPHAARSGHQGTAMALAPLAHVLWSRIMRYDGEALTVTLDTLKEFIAETI